MRTARVLWASDITSTSGTRRLRCVGSCCSTRERLFGSQALGPASSFRFPVRWGFRRCTDERAHRLIPRQPVHARIMSAHLWSMLGVVIKHCRICEVLLSAQASAELWFAYLMLAMARDEESLEEIAANSAVTSRARVHELLGRNDVQVSCVCPCVCVCVLRIAYVLLFCFWAYVHS